MVLESLCEHFGSMACGKDEVMRVVPEKVFRTLLHGLRQAIGEKDLLEHLRDIICTRIGEVMATWQLHGDEPMAADIRWKK